ncbi:MAG: four helix bundle protein [Melioribacteraceae bacterium]|nr:four helix bundle protein [Melioribacteraceae bacterium]
MSKLFDLEERTFQFAKDVYLLCKKIKNKYITFEYVDQVIRASSSIGANYREANDALGKKDFTFRVRISRKEAKESTYFLRLMRDVEDTGFNSEFDNLIQESIELTKIFSSIIEKSK